VYQPISTANVIGGNAHNIHTGIWAGRNAAKMLAYQIAVFGLLSCVANPITKDRRQPPVTGRPSSVVTASGVRAPRQSRMPR
jgi:hypothetical protein